MRLSGIRTTPSTPFSLSHKALLSVYVFIPLTLIVVLVDHLFCHDYLRLILPRNPERLRLYLVLLVFPHIVASTASFLDHEYLSFYRSKLIRAVLVALGLGVLLPWVSPPLLAFWIYIGFTMFHNMSQQVGVAMFFLGKPTKAFIGWKWLTIVASILMYVLILKNPSHADLHGHGFYFRQGIQALFFITLGGMLLLAILVTRQTQKKLGIAYLWANSAMIVLSALYYWVGYNFFAIFLIRVVHDLTGFMFYVAHDQNRNALETRNDLLSLFRFTGAPIYLLSPFVAIVLANALVQLRTHAFITHFIMALSYFHYYTEGFMWKRGTPHRRFVPILDSTN